ncbi:uncharacterized protein cd44a [Brachyhypopomus gauderio]|uniref:uncharacterized protein cd44a n=1 Tax=Brachyhypopomus gauderio TaxID=698409 RepID=UPI004041DB41
MHPSCSLTPKITAAAQIESSIITVATHIDSGSPAWLRITARIMQTFLFMLVVSGLTVLHTAQGHGRCSYAGVVHREGDSRYSLTFQKAQQLCQSSHYHLATEEQLRKAYEQGLQTCRYGWIDGQRVSFLPHTTDPNCSMSNAEMVPSAQSPDSLYDVYCFIPPGVSELDCDGTSTSDPHADFSSWPTQESLTMTAKPDQDEDVLEEVMADGFIVDVKGTTLPVKNEKSQDNYQTATTTMTPHSHDWTEPTTGNLVPTTFTDFVVSEINTLTEVTTTGTTDKTEDMNMEEDTSKSPSTFPDVWVHEIVTQAELRTKEIYKAEHLNMESSGMIPETAHEKLSRHFEIPTETSFSPSTSLTVTTEEEPGSGVELVEVHISNRKLGDEIPVPEPTREPSRVRNFPSTTTFLLAETGTPGWLIIFAFCLTLGAILCILVGIATKDKWYRHKRGSLDITPRGNPEEYGQAVTLPFEEKEQEMVTLMSTEKVQNDGDFAIISLEEPQEKEYLM